MLSRRRVAQFGQAWLPMPLKRTPGTQHKVPAIETVEDLRILINQMRDYADAMGRSDPIDVVMSLRMFPDDEPNAVKAERIEELAAIGVTQVTFNGDGRDVEEADDHLRKFAEEVLQKFDRGSP